MASAAPRIILRAAHKSSTRLSFQLRRHLGTIPARRASVYPNVPPMEPHKQRREGGDVGLGELEGTEFRIEPMKRTGEDDGTMRARLVYQSRKRGTLESDLLLSTFADTYLPNMTRDQMAELDRFLDENDWDIYYWATQEPPPDAETGSGESSTSSSPPSSSSGMPSIDTTDTSSAEYAGGVEAAISEAATPMAADRTVTHPIPEPLCTGGSMYTGDEGEGKGAAMAAAAASEEPYRTQRETGEWAQTVGTFKPAYRPVPARWRNSEVLRLLRDHVKKRAQEKGGMAFMPALKQS
ncbi:DUF339-domain-containing protein [Hypoxylon sp. FL1150]|nr:DUF339-domain-containing protein [Hypoxylon sp. FL1150]